MHTHETQKEYMYDSLIANHAVASCNDAHIPWKHAATPMPTARCVKVAKVFGGNASERAHGGLTRGTLLAMLPELHLRHPYPDLQI